MSTTAQPDDLRPEQITNLYVEDDEVNEALGLDPDIPDDFDPDLLDDEKVDLEEVSE